MYKGELKERYNEEQQAVYVQGYEKGISQLHTQFLKGLEGVKLSEKDKYAVIQLLSKSDKEATDLLFYGLDIENEN